MANHNLIHLHPALVQYKREILSLEKCAFILYAIFIVTIRFVLKWFILNVSKCLEM